ncbi:MAG: hypothetical protein WCP39_00720, partial [Chlamydiota bacterium]
MDQGFSEFLESFVEKASQKEKQMNQASWILETTGSSDAASLAGSLRGEYLQLYSDKDTYQKLL